MGRNTNPNQKPIAAKKELSGAAKDRKRKLDVAKSEKDRKNAAIFFRKKLPNSDSHPGQSGAVTSSGDCGKSDDNPVEVQKVPQTENNGVSNTENSSVDVDVGVPDSGFLMPSDISSSQLGPSSMECDVGDLGVKDEEASCEDDFDASDPSTWRIPLSSHQHGVLLNIGPTHPSMNNFPKIRCHSFNPSNFFDRDGARRNWIMYSRSTNSLFCFSCILFPGNHPSHTSWTKYGNGRSGYQNFGHQIAGIKMHEQSDSHFQSSISWREYENQSKTGSNLDQLANKNHFDEMSFWRKVLHGLIDAILFLAKNNLAFQGSSDQVGDPNCGNFLSLVELLAKYYSPLAVHLSRIKSGGSRVTYLSHKIQNEFIDIIAGTVRNTILESVKHRRYFSIIFDATPDISHQEQISYVIRSVDVTENGCAIEESFLGFIHFDLKTGLEISNLILNCIKEDGLDIKYCRGQAYDNGSNMSGRYKGVQARICDVNPLAVFLPCAAHSLNLVGQNAASKILTGKLILGQIQNLFNFFSCSPFRWNVLKKHTKRTLKCQSSTRWSSKAVAVSVLIDEFEGVTESLLELANSEDSNAHTLAEATSHFDLVFNFKFVLASAVWNLILDRINVCNQALQTKEFSIQDAANHLEGLILWLLEFKNDGFGSALEVARSLAERCSISETSGFETRITRGVKPKKFQGEKEGDFVKLSPLERFKVEFFDKIVDKVIEEFQIRFDAINTSKKNFEFLWGSFLANATRDDLCNSAKSLFQFYTEDLKLSRFLKEVYFLKSAVKPFLKSVTIEESTPKLILDILVKHGLRQQFDNVVTALQIFLTLPVSVASNERSFSKLKIIKNYLRSTMGQKRLTNLSILSIEHNLVRNISFDGVIDDFVTKKCRRVSI